MVLLIGWFSAAAGAGAITGWPGTKGAAAAADESCRSACSSPAGGGRSDSAPSCGMTDALDSGAADALDSGATGSLDSGAAGAFDSGATGALDSGATGALDSGAAGALDSGAAGALDSGAAGALDSGAAGALDSGAADTLDSGATGAALLTGAAEWSVASAQPGFSHSAAASDDASRE